MTSWLFEAGATETHLLHHSGMVVVRWALFEYRSGCLLLFQSWSGSFFFFFFISSLGFDVSRPVHQQHFPHLPLLTSEFNTDKEDEHQPSLPQLQLYFSSPNYLSSF